MPWAEGHVDVQPNLVLSGKVAVVTGAGSGLGRGIALHLAEMGATVIGLSLLQTELDELGRAAQASGHPLMTQQIEVGKAEQVHQAVAEILSRSGQIDLLVNNAGVIVLKPVEEMTVAEFDRVIATNLRSVFVFAHEVVPAMRQRAQGLIVNVSSQSGIMGFVGESGYCSAKHGVEGLTKTLALELADSGVSVISVTPGAFMRTAMSLITLGPAEQAQWREPAELAPAFSVLATQVDQVRSGERYDIWRLAQSGSVATGLAENTPLRLAQST
ncbi:MAG: SDR family oxidoreductase [Candidatus Dormiibacterota bacterium]